MITVLQKINSFAELFALTDSIITQAEDKEAEIKANKKPLLQELLKEVPSVLEYADNFDVNGLNKFLKEDSQKSLIVISSGSTSTARYMAVLYGMHSALAMHVTPYMANALSDETIKNSKILLITKSGADNDARYITERVLALNPTNFVVITSTREERNSYGKIKKNYVRDMIVSKNPEHCFTHNFDFKDGFIAVNSTIFTLALIYRAFNQSAKVLDTLKVDLNPQNNFTYCLNNDEVKDLYGLPSLKRIKQFVILYGNLTEPIAFDIESKFIEGGLISAQICDYRNFCHGRFTFISNHVRNANKTTIQSDTAIVLLSTPREKHIIEDLRLNVIPQQMPIVILDSNFDDEISTVDLIIKSSVFCSEVSNAHKVNINSPQNYANIKKTYPKTNVDFLEDFNQYGCLRAYWNDMNETNTSENQIQKKCSA